MSGGTAAGQLDRDLFFLGEMLVGEARTEIARVALPQRVAGEPLELTVTAKYKDLASGKPEKAKSVIKLRYSNDIGLIASSRHGDVIAYASALAMVRRLQRNFLGSQAEALGGLRPIVTMQADLARRGSASIDTTPRSRPKPRSSRASSASSKSSSPSSARRSEAQAIGGETGPIAVARRAGERTPVR